MNWLISGLCCISAVEILMRSGMFALLNRLNLLCRKALRVISSGKISDHWKEKALFAYARTILVASIRLMLALLLVFSPFIAAVCLTAPLDMKLHDFLVSPQGLAGATLVAASYGFARRAYVKS